MLQAPQNRAQLPSAPTTRLRGPRSRRERRVQGIDIEGQVDGVGRADALDDLLDDALGADLVDLAGLDDLEAAVPVVLVVAGPAERGADARVDVGVVGE